MMRYVITAVGALALGSAAQAAPAAPQGAPLAIRNKALEVKLDPRSGRFSLTARPSGRQFAADGRLRGDGGTAKLAPASDKRFGEGQSIEVAYPDGSRDTILLFPNLPFALFRSSLRNAGGEAVTANKVPALAATLDVGRPAAEVRVLGTGGLKKPDANPGSYVWTAVADPKTRSGVVGAWLTEDRGSGVVFTDADGDKVRLQARLEYGRLRLKPGKEEPLETFALGYFDDARLGLEAWADAVAKVYDIHLPPQPAGYCTWYHAGASNERDIVRDSEFAAKELKPFGFSVIQIDDGWQDGQSRNGPSKNFTRVRPNGPYAGGMKATADAIKAQGLVPGLWFMPFAGTYDDPWFAEHQDWFVQDEQGKPYDTAWGGTCLDMTDPGAREYLRSVVHRITHEWGYRYLKMDGMWTGTATRQIYVNDAYKEDGIGDAVFHDPDKTNIEAYRDGLKVIREAAGKDVFLLGCCISQNMRSFGGALGLVDAFRIGPDNGGNWGGAQTGPRHGSREYFLNGRVWYNDPDPVYVRTALTVPQAQSICSWVAVTSSLYLSSEAYPSLPPERLDILKRTMPSHGLPARPADLFEAQDIPRVWTVSDTRRQPRRDVVALFNWSDKPASFDETLAYVGLPANTEYVAFDYWANAFLPPFKGSIRQTLPPTSCRILALRPVADHPQLISTSRHVMQGMVDVLEETWDAKTRILRGKSAVVAGDPYELRIVATGRGKSWNALGVDLSPEDTAAGVKAELKETNGLVRVAITSPAGRQVAWAVRFQPAAKASGAVKPVEQLAATVTPTHAVELSWAGADGVTYEVSRDGAPLGTTHEPRWTDAKIERDKQFTYAVVARDWSGRRAAPATVTAEVPPPPALPPLPPVPQVRLTSLKPAQTKTGWGALGTGKSAAGNPLRVGGKTYEDGIGVHAVARLVYDCKPEYRRFVAVAGLDDEVKEDERASVILKVIAQGPQGGKELATSPLLTFAELSHWRFDVPLPAGTRKLILVVEDGGDGIAADHADWVDAGFVP